MGAASLSGPPAGNFHAFILFKTDDELKAVSDAVHRLVHRAIALDGTCTCSSCGLVPELFPLTIPQALGNTASGSARGNT